MCRDNRGAEILLLLSISQNMCVGNSAFGCKNGKSKEADIFMSIRNLFFPLDKVFPVLRVNGW